MVGSAIVLQLLVQDQPEDFVIAIGVQYSVSQFIEWSAQELGITLSCEGEGFDEVAIVEQIEGDKVRALRVGQVIVKIDPRYFRQTKVEMKPYWVILRKPKPSLAGPLNSLFSKCVKKWSKAISKKPNCMRC